VKDLAYDLAVGDDHARQVRVTKRGVEQADKSNLAFLADH
jgi:hypothetical protein